MAYFDEKERGNIDRAAGSSVARGVSTQTRAASQRQTGKLQGNPGTFIGLEEHGDFVYARYQAIRGTWISSSLAERGYDQRFGSKDAFGAYLGAAVDSQLQPLKKPDRIEPGLEYLIPVRAVVRPVPAQPPGPAPTPKGPLVTPQTTPAPTPWKEGAAGRAVKDLTVAAGKLGTLRYPSFELNDDAPPPDPEPGKAVAFWLKNHALEIAEAERKFNVSRIAIAGVIAWEALVNPQLGTVKSAGPGKMHLKAEPGEKTWPEAIENAGKMPKLSLDERFKQFRTSRTAVFYIAAAFDLMAEEAENSGWNIRGSPELLGQLYHAWTYDQWSAYIKQKSKTDKFALPPGAMGDWIGANRQYLEEAVGKSKIP